MKDAIETVLGILGGLIGIIVCIGIAILFIGAAFALVFAPFVIAGKILTWLFAL